ncbi:hypothetical protein ARAM_003813 [Aspergillus rambellii]|uniref:Transcription factor TFIIIC triple barrel domain-containing protein n=3 Tax=Aspergillus subgen. Nidulantes TaxID=2720870 RepID=A0A0F8W2Q6_9EURO|nr:hypothetical protein ARAM_003813 [Aspergillus rambellii]KKK13796.1 hypothetical protein AOCH_007380 [Aspergillus ochraceoroseus]
MSALDPGMPSHPLPADDEDSDYEYEYHDTETETFYLNIDLTTHHGPIRPARRRHDPSSSTATATTGPPSAPSAHTDDQDPAIASSESDNVSAERVQILGLHTANPIISYQNQIFSGSWADQIGTELFFSRPGQDASFDPDAAAPTEVTPLKHTKDFDLIAANSVKILSRKATLISSSSSGGQVQNHPDPLQQPLETSSAPETPGVYKPDHQSNQARFLGRLMELKKRRGETDTVRTVFSSKRGSNLEERLRGWAQTDEQLAAIQQLNDRALQGDSEAIMELENLYTQLGNQGLGPSENSSRPG